MGARGRTVTLLIVGSFAALAALAVLYVLLTEARLQALTDAKETEAGKAVLTSPSGMVTAIESVDGNIEIRMAAYLWAFNPSSVPFVDGGQGESSIQVRQGQTVLLRIKSLDVPHGFAIQEFGVSAFLPPGEEVLVKFKADKAGSFGYLCTVFCGTGHPRHRGVLLVTPS